MKINENNLAKTIALREGGKTQVSIAQVKEVQRLLLEQLATHPASEVMELVERHVPRPPEPIADADA